MLMLILIMGFFAGGIVLLNGSHGSVVSDVFFGLFWCLSAISDAIWWISDVRGHCLRKERIQPLRPFEIRPTYIFNLVLLMLGVVVLVG
jgi:hypothetical protein